METENSKWFLGYTKSREENRAKRNLENQGFEIFLPMVSYENRLQSRSTSSETMFPRYFFIKINIERDRWTLIKSTRGVSHLVTFGQKFAEVPSQVIEYLKSRTDENGIFRHKVASQEFQKGDKLIIEKGIFKDREATFLLKTSKERVKILLRFLNHQITAEIPASNVGQKEIIQTFKL